MLYIHFIKNNKGLKSLELLKDRKFVITSLDLKDTTYFWSQDLHREPSYNCSISYENFS